MIPDGEFEQRSRRHVRRDAAICRSITSLASFATGTARRRPRPTLTNRRGQCGQLAATVEGRRWYCCVGTAALVCRRRRQAVYRTCRSSDRADEEVSVEGVDELRSRRPLTDRATECCRYFDVAPLGRRARHVRSYGDLPRLNGIAAATGSLFGTLRLFHRLAGQARTILGPRPSGCSHPTRCLRRMLIASLTGAPFRLRDSSPSERARPRSFDALDDICIRHLWWTNGPSDRISERSSRSRWLR